MRMLRALTISFAIAVLFSGCKKDAPIYPPEGSAQALVVEVDNGTDPPVDATYTIPIGAINTIAFQVDGGETITLTAPTAKITVPDAQATTGYTQILASQTTPEVTFQLNFSAVSKGERANDLLGLIYKTFKLADDGGGKVKTTTFVKIEKSYHIRGYFKVLATDDGDGSKHTVIGSFNIQTPNE